MFKKETEYALRAVIYIQAQNLDQRRPGIVEIASETEAPQPFIAKILHKLVRQGVLSSLKGKGGGFFLDSQIPSPTLKELITLIEGDKIFVGCGFGMKSCDENNPCPLHESYKVIRQKINDLVTSETIHSMALKTRDKRQLPFIPEGKRGSV